VPHEGDVSSGGEFTLNGTRYEVSTGRLAFDGPDVVIPKPRTVNFGSPEEPEFWNQWFFPDVPFRFNATVTGVASSGQEKTVQLLGSGLWEYYIATPFNPETNTPHWLASYVFSSPAPVPEPGSLLLLGVGVVALMRRRRSRGRGRCRIWGSFRPNVKSAVETSLDESVRCADGVL
jgi:hypothetical protein